MIGTKKSRSMTTTSRFSRLAIGSILSAVSPVILGLLAAAAQSVPAVGPVFSRLMVFAVIAPVMAIVLGVVARAEIRSSEGMLRGRGLATTGIVLGALTIVAGVLVVVVFIYAFSNFTF